MTTHWAFATGTTSATASIAAAIDPTKLVVIDAVYASMTLGAAGDITLSLDSTGISPQALAIRSAPTGELSQDFAIEPPNGFPIWNASNSDSTPDTSVTVAITGTGTPTAARVYVLYHYEKPSQRRS